jgi:hypothetical protein
VKWVNGDEHLVAVSAPPRDEVAVLGSLSFSEDKNFASRSALASSF